MAPASHIALTTLAALSLSACLTYRPVVVDRKTSLENEILGRFELLNQQLPLVSAGGEPARYRQLPVAQRRALQALLDRQLNETAVREAKEAQQVSEAPSGLLALTVSPADLPQGGQRLQRLVEAENRAREAIMQGVIALDPELGAEDLPAVRRIFHRLHLRSDRVAQ